MNFNLLLSKIGISYQLTQDITLLVFIVLASFAYGTFIGRYKLMTVLINIYISFAVINVIPVNLLGKDTSILLVFFVLLVGLTLASRRFFDISFSGSGTGFLWRVFSMSFLQVGLILSIAFSVIPRKVALVYISSAAHQYLASEWAKFIWMTAPLVYMFLLYRRDKKSRR